MSEYLSCEQTYAVEKTNGGARSLSNAEEANCRTIIMNGCIDFQRKQASVKRLSISGMTVGKTLIFHVMTGTAMIGERHASTSGIAETVYYPQ